MRNYPQFLEVMPHLRADCPRVTQPFAFLAEKLAWLSRTLIAVWSGRINRKYDGRATTIIVSHRTNFVRFETLHAVSSSSCFSAAIDRDLSRLEYLRKVLPNFAMNSLLKAFENDRAATCFIRTKLSLLSDRNEQCKKFKVVYKG